MVALPRTAEAVGAAWRLFIICGVGIGLALFGTVLLYLAALPALGAGLAAMSWTALDEAAPRCDSAILNLAFVFMLIGYGTKAALAPLHTWMPNAHAEGPTPVSAVLAGSVLNVALVVILRLRAVMAANVDAMAPGPPIMALGLLSLLVAAFSLWRRQDVKSFFAFSSIEQTGVAAFAFGLGGEAALFGGLLHMTLHTLAKAAIFQSVGRVAQLKRSQRFGDIGGLLTSHRLLGLTLAAGIVAIAALPPFGLFTSEFLIATETLRRAPLLSLPLGVGLVTGAWAMTCGCKRSASARPPLIAGRRPPPSICCRPGCIWRSCWRSASSCRTPCSPGCAALRLPPRERGREHHPGRARRKPAIPAALPADARRLVRPGTMRWLMIVAGTDRAWAEPGRVHALFMHERAREVLPVATLVAGDNYPALSPGRPLAAWFERAVRDLWGYEASGGVDARPWLDHGRWNCTAADGLA